MNVNTFYGCDENYDPKPTAQNNLFSHLENPQLQTWWALKEAIGMDLENTTPVQKTELWDIYNNDGIAYGDALSYLHALDETDEYPLLVMPEDKSLYVNPFNDKEERSYKISLTVSPNPANDVIRITYPPEVEIPLDKSFNGQGNPKDDKSPTFQDISLSVSPNPSAEVIYISYPPESDDHAILTIFDGKGTEVFRSGVNNDGIKEVVVKDWTEGIYFVNFSADGMNMGHFKFSVIH